MGKVSIPKYTLSEELINSISHGLGAGLAIAALVLLIIRANSAIGVCFDYDYFVYYILYISRFKSKVNW